MIKGTTILERSLNRAMEAGLTAVRTGRGAFSVPSASGGGMTYTVRRTMAGPDTMVSPRYSFDCTCPATGMCKHIAAVMMLVCAPRAVDPATAIVDPMYSYIQPARVGRNHLLD